MGEQKEPKARWGERRREKRRLKAERSGDTPEKRSERQRKPSSADQDDAARRAGTTGNVGGSGIL
jgi:hypothetical protein